MTNPPTYGHYSDPSHGWLAVPVRVWQLSGAKISEYSYWSDRSQMVYLEEDADAPAFIKATDGAVQIKEHHSNRHSRIRNLPRCDARFQTIYPTRKKYS